MELNLLGHGPIDYVVVFIFILYAIYAALTKTHRILYILPAAVSFFFFIEIGPRLTPDKLVPTVFLLFVILRYGWNYFKSPPSPLWNWILVVFLVLVLSSFVGAYFTQAFAQQMTSPFLGSRLYVQLIGYVNAVFIFLIVRRECIQQKSIDILLKSFIWTTTILVVYGIYQYYANEFGLPYRGIVYSASKVGFALVKSGEETFFRVNSFANEPKRLTYFIVIGILILIKYRPYFYQKIGRILTLVLLIVHLVVLWWTYSTSIYFSIAAFIFGLLIYGLFINYNKRLIRNILMVSVFTTIGYFYQQQQLDQLYEVRVEDQLENEKVRVEIKGWEYIKKYPGSFILGLGPGMYNFALSIEYPGEAGISYSGSQLIPFNVALMTYIYDFGIIGIFILLIPLWRLIFIRRYNQNQLAILVFFIYCVCLTLDPTSTLFLLLGAFDAEEVIRR